MPTLTSGPPQTLTAWLHVTNACNLDCPYCYVRKSSARMTETIGELALQQLMAEVARQKFKQLKIKYAGGEASLHYKMVQHLHDRATELTLQQEIELQEVLLTNGVLISAELADWLVESQVKVMVSLDGIGEKNDRQRPFRDGRPSFSRIEETIDQVLLPRGIRPDISVTITRLNADGIADVMRWILARDLPFSLNFYRENMQSRSRTELQLEEQAIIDGMRAAYRVIEEILPTRPFFNGLLDRVQGQAHTHTCGVGIGYVVISHEGKLAQCQMHLDHARVNIEDTESLLPIVASGPIKNISVEAKEGCRDCSFKYLCTGGCPIETFRATGRWDVQSPNCSIYKTLLPEAIRLEGLRILKAAGHWVRT
ncbi:MAG TPA: radical SAM protein [Blastocatellia bacterium]|nr:radical SAM protein [Blastocatellia bacterium]